MIDFDRISAESGGEFRGLFWWLRYVPAALCVAVTCIGVSVFIVWGMR